MLNEQLMIQKLYLLKRFVKIEGNKFNLGSMAMAHCSNYHPIINTANFFLTFLLFCSKKCGGQRVQSKWTSINDVQFSRRWGVQHDPKYRTWTRYGRKTSFMDVYKAVDKILVILAHRICKIYCINATTKGQLNSEWIFEVIISPKMPT